MAAKRMIYAGIALAVVIVGCFAWKLTARTAYESAEYTVVQSDGPFEIRQYPDLMMATTNMRFDVQGNDGSFMRLFRYISGANDDKQKVAMTTPVFMEAESADDSGQMGFVIPKTIAQQGVPEPSQENVRIQKRVGGRFAVIRFSGRIHRDSCARAEERLRDWIERNELTVDGQAEVAGYDPPWTPGPLRRNEVLIRLRSSTLKKPG